MQLHLVTLSSMPSGPTDLRADFLPLHNPLIQTPLARRLFVLVLLQLSEENQKPTTELPPPNLGTQEAPLQSSLAAMGNADPVTHQRSTRARKPPTCLDW